MRRACILALCLTACGDDGVRHTPDAAHHDGAVTPDAVPDTPAPLSVTLTTLANGGPSSGVQVYFQNADGTVVLSAQTDATGTASAVMAAGGYVTAINPYGANIETGDELDTFAGVKPGDHLVLSGGFNFAPPVTVTVIADADPAATGLTAYSSCGSAPLQQAAVALAAPRATFTLYNCGATTDFLIVSTDNNGAPLNFFSAPNVAISDQATIDLTGTAYAAVPTRTYTYTNANAVVSFQDALLDAHGAIYSSYQNTDQTGSTMALMPGFTGAEDLMVTSFYPGGSNQLTLVDWGPYTNTFTTDPTARALPLFNNGSPNFDATTHTMTFGESGGTLTPDFVYAAPQIQRPSDNKNWTWRIAAAHTTSIVFPQIPKDVYDYNANANDNVTTTDIGFGHVPGGWDAVRPYVLSKGLQPESFVTGASGTAEINRYALLVQGRRAGDTMVHHAPSLAPRVQSHRVR